MTTRPLAAAVRLGVRSVLATSLLLLATATTASAHPGPDTCAGSGTMTTPAMFTVLPGPIASGAFSLSFSTPCTGGNLLSMSGLVDGYCADATGTGTALGHHAYSFMLTGTTMTFTGAVVGSFQVVPAIGQSCTAGGVTSWVVTGSVTLVPSPPETCGGSGTMTTSALYFTGLGPSTSGGFVLTMPGACPGGDLTMSGTMTGHCENASGTGQANGHSFSYTIVLTTMTFSGDVVGELEVVPAAGQSCATGATTFTAVGTVTLL